MRDMNKPLPQKLVLLLYIDWCSIVGGVLLSLEFYAVTIPLNIRKKKKNCLEPDALLIEIIYISDRK
jgi:hypothetical protein